MRAGDRHPLLEPHQLGEHQRARHDRDALLARRDDLGVVGLHRRRYHHDIGAFHVGRLVRELHFHPELDEPLGRAVLREVRAAHLVALVHQHLGNAAHARAADADEMDAPDLVLH